MRGSNRNDEACCGHAGGRRTQCDVGAIGRQLQKCSVLIFIRIRSNRQIHRPMWQQHHQLLAIPQQYDDHEMQNHRKPQRFALSCPREIVLQLNQKMRNIVRIEPAIGRLPMLRFKQVALFRLFGGRSEWIARRNLGDWHQAEAIKLRATGNVPGCVTVA